MKKILGITLSLMLSVGLSTACGSNQNNSVVSEKPTVQSQNSESSKTSATPQETEEITPSENVETQQDSNKENTETIVRASALKGPTAMGMVKLMSDNDAGITKNRYDFTIATTDEIVPKVSKGEIDIAALPANLASVLYNNTDGKIQVAAINTLGVLYVVEKGDSIQSMEDLKGKTIYSAGKGSTPEFVLNYLLTANGIDPLKDVTIEYKSEAAEIIPLLAQNDNGIAVLPEPFVTNAKNKIPELRTVLDLTNEWEKVSTDGSTLITGVIAVNRDFAEKNPELITNFLNEYQTSTEFAQTNIDETAALIGEYGIVDAEIAKQALPNCGITFYQGAEMKEKLNGYLTVLFEQNPESIGGSIPSEDFYYFSAQ